MNDFIKVPKVNKMIVKDNQNQILIQQKFRQVIGLGDLYLLALNDDTVCWVDRGKESYDDS